MNGFSRVAGFNTSVSKNSERPQEHPPEAIHSEQRDDLSFNSSPVLGSAVRDATTTRSRTVGRMPIPYDEDTTRALERERDRLSETLLDRDLPPIVEDWTQTEAAFDEIARRGWLA